MREIEVREITEEEYKADMQKLLNEKGLKDAVKGYCKKINGIITSIKSLTYIPCRDIQEYLTDIECLCELAEKGAEDGTKKTDSK